MSDLIIKKNGTDYKLPMLAEHYPADRVYLDGDVNKTVQDMVGNLSKIVKKKTITVSTPAPNKVAGIGLTISNAIPIAVECTGTCAFIGSHYQGEWLISFYSYGTGEQEVVTNKTVTVYYIDLTKISVQS